MRTVYDSLRWLGRKLFFLLTMALGTLALLLLPTMLTLNEPPKPMQKVFYYHLEAAAWWNQLAFHLRHLWHGQVIPPYLTVEEAGNNLALVRLAREQDLFWHGLAKTWWPSLLTTLKLVVPALVVGVVVGILLGWLLSSLAPNWARRPAWGLTAVLSSLPDLLIATALDLGLVLVSMALGRPLLSDGMKLYGHFIGPVLALALLIIPYVARVTAAAIEEVGDQLYVRTAVAKGVHPNQLVLKHMGKPVLIQVWTALPVVTAMLISGTAIVEYFMEIPGLGRALLLFVGPGGTQLFPYKDPYAGVLLVAPLLLLFTAVTALSELGLRKLDPRVGARSGGSRRTWSGQPRLSVKEWAGALVRAPRTVGRAALEGAQGLAEAAGRLPAGLTAAWKALRDPVLLFGVLMVGALVTVAVLAPRIAPYVPDRIFKLYQDEAGHIFIPPFTPSPAHPLGTDELGRDVFSRLVYGTRYALLFTGLAVPTRFLLAVLLGMPAAWKGGRWNRLVDWLTVVFTAVPQVLVPLVLVNMVNRLFLGNTAAAVAWGVLLVALPGVPRLASSIRQQAEAVMAQPFLEGAVAGGAGTGRILFRHLLPHMAPGLMAMLVSEVPPVLTMTATLAYFRVVPGGWIPDDAMGGVPALPEWGSMMQSPLTLVMAGRWWMWAPFVALFVAVLAFAMLGEGLRRRIQTRSEWGWNHKAA